MTASTRKITWLGPDRRIPDARVLARTGETIEIPAELELGGEGLDWIAAKTPKPKPDPEPESKED